MPQPVEGILIGSINAGRPQALDPARLRRIDQHRGRQWASRRSFQLRGRNERRGHVYSERQASNGHRLARRRRGVSHRVAMRFLKNLSAKVISACTAVFPWRSLLDNATLTYLDHFHRITTPLVVGCSHVIYEEVSKLSGCLEHLEAARSCRRRQVPGLQIVPSPAVNGNALVATGRHF